MRLHLNDREDGIEKPVYCVGCGDRLRTFNMLVCPDCLGECAKYEELNSHNNMSDINEL